MLRPPAPVTTDACEVAPAGCSCVSCGYDLVGLFVDGKCPECGTPIAESTRPGPLGFLDKRDANLVSIGAQLLMWSIWAGGATVLAFVLLAASAASCRTVSYGRLSPLSKYEREHFTCADLDEAIAEAEAWRGNVGKGHVREEAVAVLLDFGIGNSFERRAAIESANVRIANCKARKEELDCPSAAAVSPEHRPFAIDGASR